MIEKMVFVYDNDATMYNFNYMGSGRTAEFLTHLINYTSDFLKDLSIIITLSATEINVITIDELNDNKTCKKFIDTITKTLEQVEELEN